MNELELLKAINVESDTAKKAELERQLQELQQSNVEPTPPIEQDAKSAKATLEVPKDGIKMLSFASYEDMMTAKKALEKRGFSSGSGGGWNLGTGTFRCVITPDDSGNLYGTLAITTLGRKMLIPVAYVGRVTDVEGNAMPKAPGRNVSFSEGMKFQPGDVVQVEAVERTSKAGNKGIYASVVGIVSE